MQATKKFINKKRNDYISWNEFFMGIAEQWYS